MKIALNEAAQEQLKDLLLSKSIAGINKSLENIFHAYLFHSESQKLDAEDLSDLFTFKLVMKVFQANE